MAERSYNRSFAIAQRSHRPSTISEMPDLATSSTTRALQPMRRKRASKPKVKTGCITCKIRRVKCDERKPSCDRCTSTGRKCDGYQFVQNETSDVVLPLASPRQKHNTPPRIYVSPATASLVNVFDGTVQERRAFHRFQFKTVPAFAGGSEVDFWASLVLKAAVGEPVIRNAVIALGTLHEDYENRSGLHHTRLILDETHQDATFLYGRAVRHLYQRIDRSPGETARLAVIASVLFTCFEVLRRNNMAAVVHYQAGMRELLRQMDTRDNHQRPTAGDGTGKKAKTLMRQQPTDDLDRMLRVFARYDVQACTFSKIRAEPLESSLPALPPSSLTMTEVKRYLDNLLIAAYQMVKSDLAMYRYWRAEDVPLTMYEQRAAALDKFEAWLGVLDEAVLADAVALRAQGFTASKSILGLLLQARVAIIMLKTCINCGPESSFDVFYTEFKEMVSRVEMLTTSFDVQPVTPLAADNTPFTMELGVVHPLFFIATKCRDWDLRRRAIEQLKRVGKEGVWEGPVMAVVVDRVRQLEEQGLAYGEYVPEPARIHEVAKDVVYDDRIVRAEMTLAADSTWKHWTKIRELIKF